MSPCSSISCGGRNSSSSSNIQWDCELCNSVRTVLREQLERADTLQQHQQQQCEPQTTTQLWLLQPASLSSCKSGCRSAATRGSGGVGSAHKRNTKQCPWSGPRRL